jgi:hypothetical protein
MLVAAGSDREIAKGEIGIIGDLVDHLPIFCGIDRTRVIELATACSEQLAGPTESTGCMRRFARLFPDRCVRPPMRSRAT